jgi:hypothetical protein
MTYNVYLCIVIVNCGYRIVFKLWIQNYVFKLWIQNYVFQILGLWLLFTVKLWYLINMWRCCNVSKHFVYSGFFSHHFASVSIKVPHFNPFYPEYDCIYPEYYYSRSFWRSCVHAPLSCVIRHNNCVFCNQIRK